MASRQLLQWHSKQHGLTQRTTTALARDAGLDRQKVDRWLKGEVQIIGVDELVQLSDAFSLSLRGVALRSNTDIQANIVRAVMGSDLPFDPATLDDTRNRFVLRRSPFTQPSGAWSSLVR